MLTNLIKLRMIRNLMENGAESQSWPVLVPPQMSHKRLVARGQSRVNTRLMMAMLDRPVSGVRKNWRQAAVYSRAQQPTAEQVRELVMWAQQVKQWSLGMLSVMTGIPPRRLGEIRKGAAATLLETRVLWLYWMLDQAPQLLYDPWHLATWGRYHGLDLPRRRNFQEARREMLAFCLAEKETGRHPHTPMGLARRFNMCLASVRHAAKKAGLRLADGRARSHQIKAGRRPAFLDTCKPYLYMDWRKTYAQLMKEWGVSQTQLIKARQFYLKLSIEKLRGHFTAVGNDPKVVDGIFAPRRGGWGGGRVLLWEYRHQRAEAEKAEAEKSAPPTECTGTEAPSVTAAP